jgi:hypothetical protein
MAQTEEDDNQLTYGEFLSWLILVRLSKLILTPTKTADVVLERDGEDDPPQEVVLFEGDAEIRI